ncbi:L,D-transpeptidase family protein [Bdellovibrio sp. SKB1291214]|uniref:L,D-transpeptidase family protein n=1 Tax=Bdellovibrio sp. SKB1291214 TaxID=1732569 RepID=UPI000B516BDF|nr:L,D-transpeptidase family protein [Bdellovibrio sp. SKB1291214]UYL09729.1 L,D-transpeptidase family protein [Bdellovibrio sp. SKB1291214]
MRILLSGCLILLSCLPAKAESVSSAPSQFEATDLLPAPLLQISETEAFSKFVFLVDKEKRKLTVFERNGEQIKKVDEFPADIGKNGGNKTKRDDARTPEGIYFLEKRLTQPEIPFNLYGGLAFTTNYPNLFDKRENKTGSGIWLHAIPDTVPLTRGSRGCVVVRNEVIKKLADYVKLNETPILIFDHVSYVQKDEHEKRRVALNSFIEGWRQSWEAQDIDKYMSYYDSDFKAPGFNFASWKTHKSNLKKQYEFIKVHLSQPYIVAHNEQLLVKTLQRYESDKHIDYGVKTIYAIKAGDTYKIIREEWAPFSQKAVTNAIAHENSMTAQAGNVQQTQ